MTTIRILHVVGIMDIGGLETLIMNIYRNIDRSKIQFDFLVHIDREGAFDKEIRALGGKIYKTFHVNKVGPIKYSNRLRDFFKNHGDYKIVHSHMNEASGIILREAKKAGIKNRIAHSHTTNPKYSLLSYIYKKYSKFFINLNSTDKFACSKEAGVWLFGSKSKFNILNNGLDIDKFKYNSKICESIKIELGLNKNDFIIGHIGNFRKVKNHKFIIETFKNIIMENKNCKLILVGDGDLRATIEKDIIEKGLKNSVKILGIRQDVENIIQCFDCMIFPSIYEGLPCTLIEAQARGLRCVVSDSITKEVDMGVGLLDFLSLDRGPKYWAYNILNTDKNYKINNINTILRCKGYDIKETSLWITKFYLSKIDSKFIKDIG